MEAIVADHMQRINPPTLVQGRPVGLVSTPVPVPWYGVPVASRQTPPTHAVGDGRVGPGGGVAYLPGAGLVAGEDEGGCAACGFTDGRTGGTGAAG